MGCSTRKHVAALVLVAGILAPSLAHADPTAADRALATDLFNRARALSADGQNSQACPLFAESQRLDPGPGTLLNLANCHELEGQTATAWSEFTEALAIVEREGQSDRVAFAEQHIRGLEPRLSRLAIVLPREVAGDAVVTRDGTAVAPIVVGTPMPVDPGEHRVEVRARGFAPWSAVVQVTSGERRELVVGPLVAEIVADPGPAPVATRAAEPPGVPETPSPRYRTPALVLGAAGLVGLSVGAVAGIIAIRKNSDSESQCDPRCTDAGYSLNGEAKTAADVSTVALIAGTTALGAGLVLFFMGRAGASKSSAAARVERSLAAPTALLRF